MSNLLHYLICIAAVTLLTLLIWWWNRGAQRRRFNQAFPKTNHPYWTTAHALFLGAIEDAYALPFGWAKRLPPDSTPMSLYLILYPEHCIYDDCENEHFLAALRRHIKRGLPDEPLTQTFETLAERWLQADERRVS